MWGTKKESYCGKCKSNIIVVQIEDIAPNIVCVLLPAHGQTWLTISSFLAEIGCVLFVVCCKRQFQERVSPYRHQPRLFGFDRQCSLFNLMIPERIAPRDKFLHGKRCSTQFADARQCTTASSPLVFVRFSAERKVAPINVHFYKNLSSLRDTHITGEKQSAKGTRILCTASKNWACCTQSRRSEQQIYFKNL